MSMDMLVKIAEALEVMLAIVLCARIFWLYQVFTTPTRKTSPQSKPERQRRLESPQSALESYVDELFGPRNH